MEPRRERGLPFAPTRRSFGSGGYICFLILLIMVTSIRLRDAPESIIASLGFLFTNNLQKICISSPIVYVTQTGGLGLRQ